jgi:hypothetical protein
VAIELQRDVLELHGFLLWFGPRDWLRGGCDPNAPGHI